MVIRSVCIHCALRHITQTQSVQQPPSAFTLRPSWIFFVFVFWFVFLFLFVFVFVFVLVFVSETHYSNLLNAAFFFWFFTQTIFAHLVNIFTQPIFFLSKQTQCNFTLTPYVNFQFGRYVHSLNIFFTCHLSKLYTFFSPLYTFVFVNFCILLVGQILHFWFCAIASGLCAGMVSVVST